MGAKQVSESQAIWRFNTQNTLSSIIVADREYNAPVMVIQIGVRAIETLLKQPYYLLSVVSYYAGALTNN